MAKKQIVELNHRHAAIAEYLLQNPSARLKDVAAAMGMSPSWVSIVTNSELFREYLRQRSREVGDATFISLQEKVQGIAHRAVEKLGEALDSSQDPAFILAAADKTLQRLGMGGTGVHVNVDARNQSVTAVQNVSSEVVSEARRKIYELAGATANPLPAPERVQAGGEGHLGQDAPRAAVVHQAKEGSGAETSGGSVRATGPEKPRRYLALAPDPESLD